jgi:uncharacterized membrane protein
MVKRLLVISLGYYLACLGALNVALILGYVRDMSNGSPVDDKHLAFVLVSFVVAIPVMLFAAIQSLMLIGIYEALDIRRWYYYCAAGAFCGLIHHSMTRQMSFWPPIRPPHPGILDNESLVLFIAGFLGGLIYWGVSGRHSWND